MGCETKTSSPGSGIPRALLLEARPIGKGPRFRPPPRGPVIGSCRRDLGARRGVHVEVFAEDRVVIVPAGIGTRAPLRFSEGRISGARCYGDLVTLEPTGVVLVGVGRRPTLGQLFRSWGEALSPRQLASFVPAGGKRVSVFVDGHAWGGSPEDVPMRPHSEIVLEVGPHVPPHASYSFPPGT